MGGGGSSTGGRHIKNTEKLCADSFFTFFPHFSLGTTYFEKSKHFNVKCYDQGAPITRVNCQVSMARNELKVKGERKATGYNF